MPRHKVPDEHKLKTEGIGLTAAMRAAVEVCGIRWEIEKSDAGRELLLIGLTFVESLAALGIDLEHLNLTDAYRNKSKHAAPTLPLLALQGVGAETEAPPFSLEAKPVPKPKPSRTPTQSGSHSQPVIVPPLEETTMPDTVESILQDIETLEQTGQAKTAAKLRSLLARIERYEQGDRQDGQLSSLQRSTTPAPIASTDPEALPDAHGET